MSRWHRRDTAARGAMTAMGPWFTRLVIVVFLITVHAAVPSLAIAMVAGAGAACVAIFLHKGRYLPRFVMDILDRLSNKTSLQQLPTYVFNSTPNGNPGQGAIWMAGGGLAVDAATNFYVWESEDAARAFFNPELTERVTALYGVAPGIRYVRIAELVDNS